MAKQNGFLNVEGSIGDITFVKTADGYIVKRKSGVSASRIATDPSFKRTRENNAEFGVAGKAGKMLRVAFGPEVSLVKDPRLIGRLVKQIMKVIHTDTTNRRGERRPENGDLTLLKGFEFNNGAQITTNLLVMYTTTIDRATGEMTVDIPAFVPENAVVPPIGATHFRIRSAGGWLDFATGGHAIKTALSQDLPLDEQETVPFQLQLQLQPAVTAPLFLLLGVEFLQELNGILYPLKAGSYNSLAIVQMDVQA